MMDPGARIDDFRCYDPRLVQILPGRIEESIEAALTLAERGLCDGVFVQGYEIMEWSFLEQVAMLSRFAFDSVHPSFGSANIARVLCNATALRISGTRVPLDLSRFDRLVDLNYEWHSHPVALESRSHLRELRLRSVGKLGREGLRLPAGLRLLWIVKFSSDRLLFNRRQEQLEEFQLSYSPAITVLPPMPGLRRLELDHVGRAGFGYDSIGSNVEDLTIEASAPIENWDFLKGCDHLQYLYIARTKCAMPDAEARQKLILIESLILPRQVAASLKDA